MVRLWLDNSHMHLIYITFRSMRRGNCTLSCKYIKDKSFRPQKSTVRRTIYAQPAPQYITS